jgi:acyl dehydratase
VQTNALAAASPGSLGLDDVRWLQPIRPGDTLRAVIEVLETRTSTSKHPIAASSPSSTRPATSEANPS